MSINYPIDVLIDGLCDLIEMAEGEVSKPVGEHSLPTIGEEFICITPAQADAILTRVSDLQEEILDLMEIIDPLDPDEEGES
jgi:hypothetical protein